MKSDSHLLKLAVDMSHHSCVQKEMPPAAWGAETQQLPLEMPPHALDSTLYVLFKFSIKELFSAQLHFW